MIIQFCGLSGAGKTTLAKLVKEKLERKYQPVEVIDGDEYRETLCKGLGFSKEDRQENVRRMAFVAAQLSKHGVISIISSINPYNDTRKEISDKYSNVKLVHVDCSISVLKKRDTKNLYRKALLPDGHPEKIYNLTGVNDSFDIPANPDLYINTAINSIEDCALKLVNFIERHFSIKHHQAYHFVLSSTAKVV
jgi:adenylylsulfate kinase